MRFSRPRRWFHGVVIVGMLLLSGLSPIIDLGQPTTAVASADTSALQWEPCPDVPDAECSWVEAPIDPGQPDGATLNLRLARLPALDPSQSQGSVLIIPGGPGVGITASGGTFGVLRPLFHLDELRETFDVVTYDPRGIGESNPLRCGPEEAAATTQPIGNEGILSAAEFEAFGRANAAFAESCFALTGELMEHLSSRESASDIEQIRQALGQDDGLVAYAGSYGTVYATAYLEEYGDNVKALVIDGVVDHSIDLMPYAARWILGTQDGFARFQEWCAQDASCALHGQDVAAVYESVVAAQPEMRAVIRGRLSAGNLPGLGWSVIAEMLASAAQGEAQPATPEPAASPAPTDPELEAGTLAISRFIICSDYGPQDDFEALAADNAAVARQAPLYAWLYPQELPGGCVGWPREATNPPHRLEVGSHPNVLVANGTHDPATPLVAAVAVWSQIPQARLLIADVDGHQVLPVSRCSFEVEAQFLADPSSLPTMTYCPD